VLPVAVPKDARPRRRGGRASGRRCFRRPPWESREQQNGEVPFQWASGGVCAGFFSYSGAHFEVRKEMSHKVERSEPSLPRCEPTDGPAPLGTTPDADSFMAFQSALPPHSGGAGGWTGPTPIIPGVRIDSVVGSGGMGVVFRAQQDHPRRTVAIKVIRPALVADVRWEQEVLERFASEVTNAARLQHPYILPVYAAGSFQNGSRTLPFLVMEFLPEPTLLEYADRHTFDRDARLELLAKVADGVAYSHLNGVIHGDLKPSNIAVRKNGFPAIRDFSLASNGAGRAPSDRRFTAPERLAGTHGYFAPEQLTGTSASARVADIYTLGVDGYLLLMGSPPPDTPAVLHDEVARRYGWDCAAVLARALEPRPDGRYQSAESFANDLRAVIRGDRPSVVRPTLADDLRRLLCHHRGAVLSAVLVAFVVAAGAVTTLWQASIAHHNARLADDRSQRLARFSDSVTTQLTTIIERLPRGTEAKWTLVDEGLNAVESLAADSPDDPEIHETLARALLEMARVCGDPTRSNIGDLNRALRACRRAQTICREVAGFEDSPRRLRLAAEISLSTAKILLASGASGAEEAWAAHDLFLRSLASEPADTHTRAMAGYTTYIALQVDDSPQLDRAAKAVQSTWRVLDSARATFPPMTAEDALNDMDGYDGLAWASIFVGRFEDADRLLAINEAILRPLTEANDVRALSGLVNLDRARAEMLELQGFASESCLLRKDIVRRLHELLIRFPDDPRVLPSYTLAAREHAACAVRAQIGPDEATREAIEAQRRRTLRDPTNSTAQNHLRQAIEIRLGWLAGRDPIEEASLRSELASLSTPPVTSESPP
jgi:serine/threonine protein kinase